MPRNDKIGAKLRHSSLLRQNTVKFGTDFTRARKKFTQALLARLYVFPSLQLLGLYSQIMSPGVSKKKLANFSVESV